MEKKKLLNSNLITYILLIIIALIVFFKPQQKIHSNDNEVSIDSIAKVIVLEEYKKQFKTVNTPQPIINIYPSRNYNENSTLTNKLIDEFKKLKNDNSKLEAYMKVIATKVYSNIHNDSLVKITVIDTVSNGILQSQQVKYKLKERKVKIYDKYYTEYLKPNLVISAGLGVSADINFLEKTHLTATVGVKNKKGYELLFNIGTKNRYNFTLKKDIFTKYKKSKFKKDRYKIMHND